MSQAVIVVALDVLLPGFLVYGALQFLRKRQASSKRPEVSSVYLRASKSSKDRFSSSEKSGRFTTSLQKSDDCGSVENLGSTVSSAEPIPLSRATGLPAYGNYKLDRNGFKSPLGVQGSMGCSGVRGIGYGDVLEAPRTSRIINKWAPDLVTGELAGDLSKTHGITNSVDSSSRETPFTGEVIEELAKSLDVGSGLELYR